jgi:hypothetical protein
VDASGTRFRRPLRAGWGVVVVTDERVAVGELTVRVFDRGFEPACDVDGRVCGSWRRFEAELEGYAAVREFGCSAWEAVHRLVSMHRGLLERRWSTWV